MTRYVDLMFAADADGVFDLIIDKDAGDFVTTQGLESAELVSLFSDRRARADEVADPLKRRGWIGDLVSDVPDDRHGSGFWLYEQRRLTPEVVAGVQFEAEQALRWQIEDGIAKSHTASVTFNSAKRALFLTVATAVANGSSSSKSYTLADATRTGLLARI